MWHWNGMGAGGWTIMLIFWLVVIALAIWAVRSTSTRTRENHALRILDERFARGQIDHDEYEERRKVLESNR